MTTSYSYTMEEALEDVAKLKETSHADGEDMIPIVEILRDDEVIAFIGMAPWNSHEQKRAAFLQVIFAQYELEGTGMRFMADAHMLRLKKDDTDLDDIPLPSQSPESVDVLLAYEWKDGEPTKALMHEYGINDDGTLEWREVDNLTEMGATMEGWMDDMVKDAFNDPPPQDCMAGVRELAQWLDSHDHILTVRRDLFPDVD